MKSLMKLSIRERMSVHLQFDISDIGQPLHQRCSELATEGRSDIHHKIAAKNCAAESCWIFPGCLAWGTSQILCLMYFVV